MTAPDIHAASAHWVPWLRLSATPGVGNLNARKLLAHVGPPETIFAQDKATLTEVAGPRLAEALLTEPEGFGALVQATADWLAGEGPGAAPDHAPRLRRILTLGDAAYPAALLQIEDPPILLYLLGHGAFEGEIGFDQQGRPQPAPEKVANNRPVFDFQHSLGMVGSRNPTAQGKDNAKAFARALAQAGITVVSGMALGIDAAAHTGALDGAEEGLATGSLGEARSVPTLAVVGTGLDRVYPRRNLALAHRIAAQGILLSEYPIGTPPLAENFPRRNRLIAGLSRGTLVVEAAVASGSLITARLAVEQGREVFAIPGSIHSGMSKGCHALIRQGAKLVEEVQDILEELPGLAGGFGLRPDAGLSATGLAELSEQVDGPVPAGANGPAAQPEWQGILDALGHDPAHLDTLQARTGLPTPNLLAQLMQLELNGMVARLPGGAYQRVRTA